MQLESGAGMVSIKKISEKDEILKLFYIDKDMHIFGSTIWIHTQERNLWNL